MGGWWAEQWRAAHRAGSTFDALLHDADADLYRARRRRGVPEPSAV